MLYLLVAGGPCTGKTTLTNLLYSILRRRGLKVYVIRDWARELIKINKEKGGPLPWTDRVNFEIEVVKKHLHEFKEIIELNPDIIIEDSGPIAAIAYCNVDGKLLPKEVINKIISHSKNIDLVLITEPNSNYFTDEERWEMRSYALKVHKEIIKIHDSLLSNKIIKLPPSPKPELRVQMVLNIISPYITKQIKI